MVTEGIVTHRRLENPVLLLFYIKESKTTLRNAHVARGAQVKGLFELSAAHADAVDIDRAGISVALGDRDTVR